MTVLVMAGILIFGIAAYRLLPVSTLPNVDFPTIQVSAELPGASPETMASAVATPLEKQFSTIPGIDEMSSVSSQGTTRITLQFALGRDIGAAFVPQGQPGRLPDLLPCPHLGSAAAVHGQRVRRNLSRAAHLDDQRRRPGAGLRP